MKKGRIAFRHGCLFLALFLAFHAFLGALPVSAATSGELQNQLQALEGEQDALQAQLEELRAQQTGNLMQIRDIVQEKSLLEQQVGLLQAQIDNQNLQISTYALLIADKQDALDAAEAKLAQRNQKNKERIRAMEESGVLSYWSVLFRANSFSDFLDRLNIIREIAAADARRLQEIREAAEEVSDAKDALAQRKAELESEKKKLAQKEAELADKQRQTDQVLQQLLAKGAEFEAWLEEQELQLSQMEQDIAKLQSAYDAAKLQEWLATSVPPTTKPATSDGGGIGGSAVTKGDITWVIPCNYTHVSSPYGWRIHPIYGDRRFHAGVDLSAGCPNEIYATRAGVVLIAQYSETAGNYVVIDHGDGYTSTYMHMCKLPCVKPGDYVLAGQVIGCVGNTGASKGCHLHFGISYNGSTVNPMDYIG